MIYRFTVTAKLVSKDEFEDVKITSDDVDVSLFPDKAAVVRGTGFRMISNQVKASGFDRSKLNQVFCVDLELDSLLWESF